MAVIVTTLRNWKLLSILLAAMLCMHTNSDAQQTIVQVESEINNLHGVEKLIAYHKLINHYNNVGKSNKALRFARRAIELTELIINPENKLLEPADYNLKPKTYLLAAKSFGLDTCPVGLGIYVEQTKIFSKLKVPDSERVFISIILGYGDESPKIHKREKNNVKFVD